MPEQETLSETAFVNVEHLNYHAKPDVIENFSGWFKDKIEEFHDYFMVSGSGDDFETLRKRQKHDLSRDETLKDVSFEACPGQVTMVISPSRAQRKALLELIARKRNYGMVKGNITLSKVRSVKKYDENVGFVNRRMMHTPGK